MNNRMVSKSLIFALGIGMSAATMAQGAAGGAGTAGAPAGTSTGMSGATTGSTSPANNGSPSAISPSVAGQSLPAMQGRGASGTRLDSEGHAIQMQGAVGASTGTSPCLGTPTGRSANGGC